MEKEYKQFEIITKTTTTKIMKEVVLGSSREELEKNLQMKLDQDTTYYAGYEHENEVVCSRSSIRSNELVNVKVALEVREI